MQTNKQKHADKFSYLVEVSAHKQGRKGEGTGRCRRAVRVEILQLSPMTETEAAGGQWRTGTPSTHLSKTGQKTDSKAPKQSSHVSGKAPARQARVWPRKKNLKPKKGRCEGGENMYKVAGEKTRLKAGDR